MLWPGGSNSEPECLRLMVWALQWKYCRCSLFWSFIPLLYKGTNQSSFCFYVLLRGW